MAIYLDNNATTPVDPAVLQAMLPYFTEQFGNASSSHAFGENVAEAIRGARRAVAALIGAAHESEIVFTSGGTESDNAVLRSALVTQDGRDEIVTTRVEHPAILALCVHLQEIGAARVHMIDVDRAGRLDEQAFAQALGPRTALASVMWANNETGTLFPIARLAAMAKEAGALFHSDCVQAAGKVPVDAAESGVDFLSFSAHKFNGPKGVGALYVKKGVKFSPLLRGGKQERGRRGGTENAPGIVGMGRAAELALARLDEEQVRVKMLRDRLEHGLMAHIERAMVLGDLAHRLPNTLDIAFECVDSEAVLHQLTREGVAASSGSACASGSMEPSHVLRAMNVPPLYLQGAVRFSLSRANTEFEIDKVASLMTQIVADVRAKSPLWRERASEAAAMEAQA